MRAPKADHPPGKTLSSPGMLSARLPVPPASELPCTCQQAVEVLVMGHLFIAVFVFKQLEKLKDQLSTEEGSEVAYALESLSASQPKKRGRFWVRPLQPSCLVSSPGLPFCNKDNDSKHAPNMLKNRLAAFLAILVLSY